MKTKRLKRLANALKIFEDMCSANEYKGAKRVMASHVFSVAKFQEDVIFQISIVGGRDIGEEISKFLKSQNYKPL